jgi:hypothetical protein
MMEQLELAPYQAHSQTSQAAAEQIEPRRVIDRDRVFNCIRAIGPATDEEIANALALNPSTERPRRVELMTAGEIRQNGKKKTTSGRQAAAWVVVE